MHTYTQTQIPMYIHANTVDIYISIYVLYVYLVDGALSTSVKTMKFNAPNLHVNSSGKYRKRIGGWMDGWVSEWWERLTYTRRMYLSCNSIKTLALAAVSTIPLTNDSINMIIPKILWHFYNQYEFFIPFLFKFYYLVGQRLF